MHSKPLGEHSIFSPLVIRRLSAVMVAALLIGSCDTPVRLSGWMLGGKDRKIVKVPAGESRGTSTVSPIKNARKAAVAVENRRATTAKVTPAVPDRALTSARAAPKRSEILGTGKFAKDTAPPERPAPAIRGGSVTLNFVDADIRDVIKTVLGTTLGQNFAIDPKVKGTITLQTSKPIPRAAVLSTLESALGLNGISIVKSNAIYRVLPSKAAARNTLRPRVAGLVGAAGEAYGVEILPLEFAAAGEMAKIIEPLAPSGAVIRTDTFRNLLIVGGTRQERETIADIVAIFDVDWLSGMSFALVPLEYAQPKQAITDLERVFGSGKGGPLDGLVQFFPVERRKSVLVVSAKPDFINRARDWIKRLDVGGEDEKRLYVYSVQNARATDLATILGQVFSDSPVSLPSSSVVPGQRQAQLSSPRRSSSSSSNTTSTVTARAFGPPISAAQATPAATPPRRRTAARPTPTQTSSASAAAPIEGRLSDDLTARIIADDVNNALVIMTRPAVWRMIEEALRKLDVVPLQVMIEATIVEVTLNDELRYGVQSFFTKGASTATLSTLASGGVSSTFPGFSYVYDQGNIRAILDALDKVTDVRVISSPQILVLDNRTAELRVGDQVPITTRQTVTDDDPTARTVNNVEFRDTGVVLRVTPRVNASGVVNLEIEQEESSAIETDTSGIDSPTIQQRKLTTTVLVNSGETVALGGLIRDRQEDSVSGIPFLSSIPLFGKLFSSTAGIGRRTELLALISPRVIRNQEEARAVTRDLRKTLHNAAALRAARRKKPRP